MKFFPFSHKNPLHSFPGKMMFLLRQMIFRRFSSSFKLPSTWAKNECRRLATGDLHSVKNSLCENTISHILRRDRIFIRDACACSMCVDPYSGQKKFKTSDIPLRLQIKSQRILENDVEIIWEHDIPGFASHISTIPLHSFMSRGSYNGLGMWKKVAWDANTLATKLHSLRYDCNQFVSDSSILFDACRKFLNSGIIFVTRVPESEEAVEILANSIGCIHNTFYGQTWDVKSIPQAHNIAYTNQSLGLHQDLLYMKDPPGIQLLHCIKNTTSGGESLFSDALEVITRLTVPDRQILSQIRIPYHYKTDKEDYRYSHPIIHTGPDDISTTSIRPTTTVSYSPPFQAPFRLEEVPAEQEKFLTSLKNFATISESPKNMFECKLKEGECVIFDNRRILHGRKAFDTQSGERWLKGCYVSSDSFRSRMRTLSRDFSGQQPRDCSDPYLWEFYDTKDNASYD